MEDEVCTCGHGAAEHEGGTGRCQAPACACPAYTEEIDEAAATSPVPARQAA